MRFCKSADAGLVMPKIRPITSWSEWTYRRRARRQGRVDKYILRAFVKTKTKIWIKISSLVFQSVQI